MEIISLLLKNETVISPDPIVPLCQACHQGPKVIPTLSESQKFLGDILPTIQQGLLEKEFLTVQLAGQGQPNSWQSVREVWLDSNYQGGCFLCRFCVPLRTHPDYRKFYLFDNRFFYLDQKWEKAAQAYYQWEKGFEKNNKQK